MNVQNGGDQYLFLLGTHWRERGAKLIQLRRNLQTIPSRLFHQLIGELHVRLILFIRKDDKNMMSNSNDRDESIELVTKFPSHAIDFGMISSHPAIRNMGNII